MFNYVYPRLYDHHQLPLSVMQPELTIVLVGTWLDWTLACSRMWVSALGGCTLNQDLFDSAPWDELVGRLTDFQDVPGAAQHLVYRFLHQYLPALLSAKTQHARDRVWYSLWSYLTSTATRAKPFALSSLSADGLIAEIQGELSRLGYREKE